MSKKEIEMLGEFGLIRRIQQQAGNADHLVKGIGDDCAIQRQDQGWELLTSTDLLIEGVHFNRQWIGMEDLGHKSAAVNFSDIAAMGGQPQSLFLGVAAPAEIPVAELELFIKGFLAESELYGATLAGGDTCRSLGPLMISVTVQGRVETGRAILRDGASIGDAIYVSGCLGDSALALSELQQNKQPDVSLLRRHNRPSARVSLGRQLVEQQLATAMLDVSDGLLADLEHILETTGLGADLDLDSLPLSSKFRQKMKFDSQLINLALAGGEDYELLFTSPQQDLDRLVELTPSVTRIGTISQATGIRIHCSDGSLYQCSRGGFDHFS